MRPHSWPSTVIGAPTTEPNPRSRAKAAGSPEESATASIRAGRLGYQRHYISPAEAHAGADGKGRSVAGSVPPADGGRRTVRVVPAYARDVGGEQPPGLRGDRGEHLLGRPPAGNQRRHPAQRRLLFGETPQCHPGLRVGDRGRGQLGKPGQPRLGIRRQRPLVHRRDCDHAPQLALDADRRAHHPAKTQPSADVGHGSRGTGVVVQAHHPAGMEHQRMHVAPADARPGSDRDGSAGAAPRGDRARGAAGVIPAQHRVADAKQPPRLLGNRGEHLIRCCRPGRQDRHPAQRGLLLGDPVVAGPSRRDSHHIQCFRPPSAGSRR